MTPEERQQLQELMDFKRNLERSSTVPLPVDQALSVRLGKLKTSTKSATSENQAVDEAGVATYSVLKAPDGFLEISVDGVTKYIPKYD